MSIKFVLIKVSKDSATARDAVLGEYVFDGSLFTIGSDATNTIVVPESASEQAVVIAEGESLTLINSADGTIYNKRSLRREAIEPLVIGDEIEIGNYVVALVSADAASVENQNGAPPLTLETTRLEPIAAAFKSEAKNPTESVEISEPPAAKPTRNFADILNTLRTEEDSFYFTVKNGTQAAQEKRILLEQPEMPLGFDARGEIAFAVEQIAALYAIVRKDWSGIVVEAQRGGAVFVNDETLASTRRLRNGDWVTFNAPRKTGKKKFALELHEPSSLIALESLLEARPGVENKSFNGAANLTAETISTVEKVSVLERNFFGYFSFFEVAAMAIGTLIGAVLIFLLLESVIG